MVIKINIQKNKGLKFQWKKHFSSQNTYFLIQVFFSYFD